MVNKFNNYKIVLNCLLIICYISLKKKKKPKISIFLPTYNKQDYIKKSVKSIQNQTLKDIEIIIVNDFSNDNTSQIVMDLSLLDNRIKVFNNDKNHGLLYSRGMGILKSSGEYILNLDADDELETNNSLEYLYNKAKLTKADIVNFNILDKGSNSTIKKCTNFENIQIQPQLFNQIFGEDNIIYDGLVWNKLIKKDIYIKSFKFFKEEIYNWKWNYFEDDIWSILVNKFANSKICVDKLVYIYNYNENSLMHKKLGIIEFENLLYRHEMYKKIFQTKNEEKYLIAEYYFLLNRLKYQINELLLINDRNLKDNINKIFLFFMQNYECSEQQKNDINNFLKLINK